MVAKGEIDAYNEALGSGQYQKPGGLLGKYDNVRRFWEDEQLGLYLRPYLERLIERRREQGGKIKVLDLGCGGGDGFEFLTSINRSSAELAEHRAGLINSDTLEHYCGVDINEGLLEQARSIYGSREDMVFVLSDINDAALYRNAGYDLYLANYGTPSHNNDEQTIGLLSHIAENSPEGAIVIIDWLGRFSYEWRDLWTRDYKNNTHIEYVISYLGSGKEDLTPFHLRLMGRQEAMDVYKKAKQRSGGRLALRQLADRSSYVGRHIDTGDYNPHAQPMRRLLNSLFEPNVTTDLQQLIISYVPKDDFEEINGYYQRLTDWWNYLVTTTGELLEGKAVTPAPAGMPAAARRAVSTMKNVVRTASRLKTGNPRAGLIEPQLAYCLRELEMGIQQGLGCGHGLVAVFEVIR